MKVHIVTKAPFPIGMASTQRIACYAEALTKSGITNEIVVVKRTETKEEGKNPSPDGGTAQSSFHYVGGTTQRSSNKFLGKLFDIVDRFKSIAYLNGTVKSGDVILMYLLDEVTFPLFLILSSHLKGVSVVRDFCEYPYATRQANTITNFIRKCYLKMVLPLYDGTICISHSLLDVSNKYAPKKHHTLVPIMVGDQNTNLKHQHPKPYIFHGGSMLERKDAIIGTMKAFVDANTKLGKKLDFILAGPKSPHIDELNSIICKNGMKDCVFFLPTMDKTTLQEYQNGAFLTILNKNDNEQNRNGFSNKLGEILIAGTPIITTTVGEAKYWLKDGESAFIVSPHNPQLISDKIIEAYNNEELRRKIGENGKKVAIRYFNTTCQGDRLSSFLNEISLKS